AGILVALRFCLCHSLWAGCPLYRLSCHYRLFLPSPTVPLRPLAPNSGGTERGKESLVGVLLAALSIAWLFPGFAPSLSERRHLRRAIGRAATVLAPQSGAERGGWRYVISCRACWAGAESDSRARQR